MRLVISTFIYIVLVSVVSGQGSMEEGFDFLETAEYEKAEIFFEDILRSHPNDITANICYGRAIGLKGDTEESLNHFKALYTKDSSHFEIGLNLAEAYMWSKNYKEASALYKILYFRDASNFVVNQGRANAFAALKRNHEALYFIQQAKRIQPANEGARLSEKYIRLAIFDEHRQDWKYDLATAQLDSIEHFYKNDREVLLSRAIVALSQGYPEQAEIYYDILLEDEIDVYEGLHGKAYTLALRNKKSKALTYARRAFQYAQSHERESNKLRSTIGLINALGVNRKYKEAEQLIKEIRRHYPLEKQFDLAAARIKAWNGDYKKAEHIYHDVSPDSLIGFEYHMGLAELHRATHENERSKNEINKALMHLPNQPDAIKLLNELIRGDQPTLHLQHSISNDNGGNEAEVSELRFDLNPKSKIKPYVYLIRRKTNSQLHEATQEVGGLGLKYRLNYRLAWDVVGNIIRNTELLDQQNYVSTYGIIQKMRFGKSHDFNLGITKEYHNYTSDLIESGLSMVNYQLAYNYYRPTYPGLFLQYLYTTQSDDNTRRSAFASLYYILTDIPTLKIGMNYLYLLYQRDESSLYFSPDNFHNYELFGEFSTEHIKRQRLFYGFFGALGKQTIADMTPQTTFRGELRLGYRMSTDITLLGKAAYSTSAQTTVAGYTHQLGNLQLIYVFPYRRVLPD